MKKFSLITLSTLGVLLLIFTFLDYQVSELLYQENHFIGRITRVGIYPPVYFFALVSVLIILRPLLISKIPYKSVTHLILGGMYLVILFAYIYNVTKETNAWFLWLVITIPILVLGSVLVVLWIPKDELFSYQKLSVLYLSVFFLMNIIVNGIKFVWVRVRFFALDDPSEFTYWFIPSGLFESTHELNSIPSGHVGTIAVLIGLIFVPLVVTKFKKYLIPIISVVSFVIVLTVLGRVLDGKHYVTDTLISIMLVLSLYLYLSRKILTPQIDE